MALTDIFVTQLSTIVDRVAIPKALKALRDEIQAHLDAGAEMQAVDATLALGTITINANSTVAANSEGVPVLIGAIAGSTNFASLGELKASRVNGAPGVGTVVIQAYPANGALDADAGGAIRVLIFTPPS